MKEASPKYRINELLNKLSVSEYRRAIKLIPKQLGVSDKTFSNYRNIKLDDIQDIPHEKVVLMEKMFDLPPGGLENFTVVINSIKEILASDTKGSSY